MKELFLASEWADRVPEAVEIAVETVLDGFAIRGRIDAVFPRDGGGFTIVDWKTGIEPDARAARHRTLQLAAYALAYARLRNLPARAVDAAFYYAAHRDDGASHSCPASRRCARCWRRSPA